ncbi:hypothetical protein H0H92_006085 [Tricholoma furcatifolium]|nr:hypothetical protein H0H92_006085 [Tricholoma furcatifolium]
MSRRPLSATSDTLEVAIHTPLPQDADRDLLPLPSASYSAADILTPRDSFAPHSSSINTSGNLFSDTSKSEVNEYSNKSPQTTPRKRRSLFLVLLGVAVLVIVILAVVLPVYFVVVRPNHHQKSAAVTSPGSPTQAAGSSTTGTPTNTNPQPSATTGGDGSIITTVDGTTFTYANPFGGFWVSDPNDPFNNNAQPNSWTPPLNQTWTWGQDHIYGVNLGGLFVLEPFITPALYQKYPGAVDEWTLSTLMAADTSATGGISQLEDHYNTFITEQDIAQIAGAGLNWVRIPIPFWAIEVWPGEPFLAQTSWKTVILSDAIPKTQGANNASLGYNHSGKLGSVNFLNGVMGIANAQRALEYIRVFTEFISQTQYTDVVLVFGIVNEALLSTIGRAELTSFYLQAHTMIRSITGYGEGNGPYISIHDGFAGVSTWAGFLEGSDRIILDSHPYLAFDGSSALSPVDTGTGSDAGGVWPLTACQAWASSFNTSRSDFGVTIAGEFSNGINDCGLFLRGVPGTAGITYGGNCSDWQDSSNWTDGTKAGLMMFAQASMDALGDWFFWTWKIANSSAGIVESPLWSYQLGLENGWMPTDPRTALGTCDSLGVSGPIFDGTFQPWQTGGAGAGTIAASSTSSYPWPPATISNAGAAASLLPTYTPTGTVATLAPPTLTASVTASINLGNGWYDAQDTVLAPTAIAGCTYPDAWDAVDVTVPPLCS